MLYKPEFWRSEMARVKLSGRDSADIGGIGRRGTRASAWEWRKIGSRVLCDVVQRTGAEGIQPAVALPHSFQFSRAIERFNAVLGKDSFRAGSDGRSSFSIG
jgi:hypothetical protein